jgi:hypothetical protein
MIAHPKKIIASAWIIACFTVGAVLCLAVVLLIETFRQ